MKKTFFNDNLTKRIVRSLNSNNVEPLLQWLDLYKEKYYKIGWAFFQDKNKIERLMQNTIILASENIETLSDIHLLEIWFTNLFINECNKNKEVELNSFNSLNKPIKELRKEHSPKDQITDLLDIVDVQTRELLILKFYGGYSFTDISKMKGIAEGTIESKVIRGLKYIRACY